MCVKSRNVGGVNDAVISGVCRGVLRGKANDSVEYGRNFEDAGLEKL